MSAGDSDASSTGPERRRSSFRARGGLLLAGAYAWVTTVAPPVFERGAPGGARVLAILALGCLLVGVLGSDGAAPRRVAVWGFFGGSVAAWAWLGPRVTPAALEPLRAALGGVGWGAFALAWGRVRAPGDVPERDPRALEGPPLEPRHAPSWMAGLALVIGFGATLAFPWLAWRSVGAERAFLAHAAALLGAVAVLAAVAAVGPALGRPRVAVEPSRRSARAGPWLAALVLLLSLGLLVRSLR